MQWFVYIIQCVDGSFYTGITNNIARRIWLHNRKIGTKSLKGKLPVKLLFKEVYTDQKEAAKREKEIKGWNRKKKLKLMKGLP
jgi:putative endonuclease